MDLCPGQCGLKKTRKFVLKNVRKCVKTTQEKRKLKYLLEFEYFLGKVKGNIVKTGRCGLKKQRILFQKQRNLLKKCVEDRLELRRNKKSMNRCEKIAEFCEICVKCV